MSYITIAIVGRSEFFRAGIHQQLSGQQNFRLMDCDPDKEPLKFIDANAVDVVLLDIDSPIFRGLELSRSMT